MPALAALLCLLSACEPQAAAPKTEVLPVPVVAVVPEIKDVPVYVESIGVLQPAVLMEIRPQVNGTLQEVLVEEGEWVVHGAPLFKIDPQTYRIRVREVQAQMAVDQATWEAAQKKLDRFKNLANKDLVARIEWDDLESQIIKAQAVLELDGARLDSAQMDLDCCTLTSPLDGRMGKLDVHPGQLVGVGYAEPLATISKLDPLIIEFTVTEKELPKLLENKLAVKIQPLCSLGCEEAILEGEITFLDNHFQPKTGLLLVRGKIANPQHTLRPGQSIRVQVPIAVSQDVKLIPQKAVRYNEKGPYVYIVQADKSVALRQVILGEEHKLNVIVLEGLDPADPVITDGHLRVSPGVKVEVKI